jgi:hypothetical protein
LPIEETFTGGLAVNHKFLAAWAFALVASVAGVAVAAPIAKLSDTMVLGGDVIPNDITISTGTNPRAVFMSDRETNGLTELWSTRLSGFTPFKLSGATTVGTSGVLSFKVSPDGNWVAFVTGQGAGLTQQLWLAVNDGSAATPTAVSGPLASSGTIRDYEWSANSQRVVFRAERDAASTIELYSKPLSGALVSLSLLPVTGRNVAGWSIAPDSSRVVFISDRNALNVFELSSVPLIGGVVTKLSGPTLTTANVPSFLISANSSRVAFLQDRDVDNVRDLYSSAIDGSTAAVKLSSGLLGPFGVTHFRITPDGTRVVYRASRDTAGVLELYGASATAVGASIKLSGTLVAGGNVDGSGRLALTPDGQRVIFMATKDSSTLLELYSAPVNAANAVVKISDPAATLFNVLTFLICPNSACVVYVASPTVSGAAPRKLMVTSTTSATLVDLSAPVGVISTFFSVASSPESYATGGFQITPDSRRTLWVDTRNPASLSSVGAQLLSSPLSAAAPVAISGQIVANGRVQDTFALSADSTKVLFSGDKDTVGVNELYATTLDGGGAILDIDGDGTVLSTTDLLLLTRWNLGIRGLALFGGITFATSATRTSVTAIEDHLRRLSETALGW